MTNIPSEPTPGDELPPVPSDTPAEIPTPPDPFVEEVNARFSALEARAIGYRQGVVTDDSPLSVALGGSAISYTSVSAIDAGSLRVGMTVGCLMLGTDLLVLGPVTSTPAGWQPGDIKLTAYAAVPPGWLECDGTSKAVATYPDLHAAIGYAFGGSGANFNVPDVKGRAPVGRGAGSGLTNRTLAQKFGTETHALTTAELASHTHSDGTLAVASHTHGVGTLQVTTTGSAHTHDYLGNSNGSFVDPGSTYGNVVTLSNQTGQNGSSHTHGLSGSTASAAPDVTGATGSAGSGTAHPNTQPSLVVGFLIKT